MEAPADTRLQARNLDVEIAAVWAALGEVADPEIPTISVVDLGIVGSVELDDAQLRVEILPTFLGCPAIEMIRTLVEERLAGIRPRVAVEVTFAGQWTTDRITVRGRDRLRAAGFAPPDPGHPEPGSAVATHGAASAAHAAAPSSAARRLPILTLGPPAPCPYCGSGNTRLENAFGPTPCRSIHHCLECRQPFEQFKRV